MYQVMAKLQDGNYETINEKFDSEHKAIRAAIKRSKDHLPQGTLVTGYAVVDPDGEPQLLFPSHHREPNCPIC